MQAASWQHNSNSEPPQLPPCGEWVQTACHSGVRHEARAVCPVAEVAASAETHQQQSQTQYVGIPSKLSTTPPPRHHAWRVFGLGAAFAIVLQFVVSWLSVTPVWERFFGRFVWNRGKSEEAAEDAPAFQAKSESTALVLYSDSAESVEWVNMCWRKVQTHDLTPACLPACLPATTSCSAACASELGLAFFAQDFRLSPGISCEIVAPRNPTECLWHQHLCWTRVEQSNVMLAAQAWCIVADWLHDTMWFFNCKLLKP